MSSFKLVAFRFQGPVGGNIKMSRIYYPVVKKYLSNLIDGKRE